MARVTTWVQRNRTHKTKIYRVAQKSKPLSQILIKYHIKTRH